MLIFLILYFVVVAVLWAQDFSPFGDEWPPYSPGKQDHQALKRLMDLSEVALSQLPVGCSNKFRMTEQPARRFKA